MASVLLVSVALACVQHVQNTEHPTYHPKTDTHQDRYTMYSIGTETNPNMITARKLTSPTRNNNLFNTNTRQASASNIETGIGQEQKYGKSNYAITPEKLLDSNEYMDNNKDIVDTIENTRMHVPTVSPKEILPDEIKEDSKFNTYYEITPEKLLRPKENMDNHKEKLDTIESREILGIASKTILPRELGMNLKINVNNQQIIEKVNIHDAKIIIERSSNHKLDISEALDNYTNDNNITNKQVNNATTNNKSRRTSIPMHSKSKKVIDHRSQIHNRINSKLITEEEHTTTSNPKSAAHSFTIEPKDIKYFETKIGVLSNNNNEKPISVQDYASAAGKTDLSSTESSLVNSMIDITNSKTRTRKLGVLSYEHLSEANLFVRTKRISHKNEFSQKDMQEFTTLTNAPINGNLVTKENLVQENNVIQKDTIDSRLRRAKELFSVELKSSNLTNVGTNSSQIHMTNSNRTKMNYTIIDSPLLANRTNQSDSSTESISHLSSTIEQIATTPEHFISKSTETKLNQRISIHITPVYDAFDRKFVNATDKIAEFSTSRFNDIANDTLLLDNTNTLMASLASSDNESQSKPDEIHSEIHRITNMFNLNKSKLELTTNPMSLTTVPSTIRQTKDVSSKTVSTSLMNISDFDSWDYQSNSSFFDEVTSTPATLNTSASGIWPVKHSAVVEGDLILGGLMMVHEREDSITCGPIMPQGGVQALEAMLYTLDRINENQTILPNVTIGAHILDDCDKDTYGLEMAVDFIKGSISNIDGAEYHCNKTQVRKVISGVVGAASSVTSIQVANLLRLFKIPQVSFFSTSPELSNKQRFEFFSRTIPSDHYQVKAMVDIIRLLSWSYVSIIYEESNYGIKAFEELEDLLQKYDICIAVKEKLVKDSGVAGEKAYDIIVQKLLTKPRARGAIVFGSDQEVAGVMRAVRRSNATGSFSWIGSDGWSARSLVSDGNEAEVEGTLSVQPQANPVQGFEEYFLGLTVENNRRNPWFVEFWEAHFHCRYPNSSKTPYNSKYKRLCTARERLSKQNTVFEDQLQFVSDAVMAFAYAIRDMHKDLCNGRPGLCDAMKPTQGTELLKYLRKVDFQGLSGDWFRFDLNGDGPARYNIIHFKQVAPGKYRWIRVGEYIEGVLNLNMSEIQFKLGHPKPPESVCSLPCDLGQAKKYVEGEMCCWHCFNCTQYQIRHATDETQCVVCLPGTLPDSTHVYCNDIPEEFLRPESGWAIGAMALSFTGILVTMFVAGVFIRFNDTPVVRASGRELSYVLLAGILMCYCVTFALVMKPTDIVCGIQRFGAGFCFTVVYAALLTKTNRISRIFNAGKHSAKRPSFISPRSQLIICSFMVFVQMIINGAWVLVSPARAIHHYPTREDNLLVCSSHVDASYMIAFGYPIFLIVICTIYAVLTRKIPEAFNESKHIGFTMYTTCVIWLAFVPLYFGTANNVALRITSMSVTISLSASVTVACLFSPKLYIILIRPERNVRQSMMPVRYSAINKSSGTTNSGAGSMMAAVRVTAVTCNQQSQIQKLVPEKDNIELSANGKAKPVMVDSGTQTVAPPPVNGNLHNTDEQKLNSTVNNNCTPLGNGPMLTQLKDVTL